jgi:hypothetical protein
MPNIDRSELDLILVEETVWVLIKKINLPNYDFDLTQFFSCRRPWYRPEKIIAIGRFGAVTNYAEIYQQLATEGIFLVHSPAQYLLASELTHWYPILEGLTPKSLWFKEAPDFNSIALALGLPLFLKGSRQTSRHRAALSIIHSERDYQTAIECNDAQESSYGAVSPFALWQNLIDVERKLTNQSII